MQIIIASQNKHKIEEIKPLIPSNCELITSGNLNITEEIPETGETIEANALQKANYVLERFHSPCFADDTGLEVEALEGRPGVYSARYAGKNKSAGENIEKLLGEMKGKTNRRARFKTVIALVGLGNPVLFEGVINGVITEAPRGNRGFGYDPVFLPDGYSHTFAEMSLDEKNKLSHRSIAVNKLVEYLKKESIVNKN